MDCVDCHNRPSHTFKPPAVEVDNALEDGRIDKTLPFIKREALRVLDGIYASHEEARAGIAREVETFYKAKYPDVATTKAASVAAAGKALGDIYAWNVFPKMKVTWGTYKSNLGHEEPRVACAATTRSTWPKTAPRSAAAARPATRSWPKTRPIRRS